MERTAEKTWMQFGAAGEAVPSQHISAAGTRVRISNWRQRGLRPLLVEDESKPMEVQNGIRLRRGTLVFIWLATLLILFAELAHRLNSTNDALWAVAITVAITFVHLSYLCLIFWLLILSSLPHRQYRQRILFPFLLLLYCAVNFGHALLEYYSNRGLWIPSARAWLPRLQFTAIILLLFYYGVWLLRDYYRTRDPLSSQERSRTKFWMAAEGIFFVVLLLRMADLLFHIFIPNFFWEHSETIVIACSLGQWVFLQWIERSLSAQTFRSFYQEYLENNTKPAFDPEKFLDRNGEFKNVHSVLDFGCGDGTRLKENLDWLGLSLENLKIHGFDTNTDWEPEFRKTFGGLQVEFFGLGRDLNPQNHYDLVVISHTLYYIPALRDVISFLKQCDTGTKVLIRGISPGSFFYFVSRMQALRLITRAQASYSWYQWALPAVIGSVGLRPLGKPDAQITEPDAVVIQKYKLDNDERSIRYAANLLDGLYGGNTRENVTEVFQELRRKGRVHELPNNDLVYVLEKVN